MIQDRRVLIIRGKLVLKKSSFKSAPSQSATTKMTVGTVRSFHGVGWKLTLWLYLPSCFSFVRADPVPEILFDTLNLLRLAKLQINAYILLEWQHGAPFRDLRGVVLAWVVGAGPKPPELRCSFIYIYILIYIYICIYNKHIHVHRYIKYIYI